MKRVISFVALCFLLCMASLQAQIRFGIRAGVNIANISNISESTLSPDNINGFQAGALMECFILNNLGFDVAALYSQRGIKINEIQINKHVGYLDIPANLKMKLDVFESVKPYVAAGPYISFNLASSKVSEQWKAKSFGAGVNVGAGIELINHLQVGLNYGLSLTDDYSTIKDTAVKDLKAKSRTWSLVATFLF